MLNLVSGTGNGKTLNTQLSWDTFIDYSGNEIQLEAIYKAGIYSPLLRNRDLDGDGIIDPEELRWYIASLDQLCGLFLGDQGLSGDAQLYPISASREPNSTVTEGPFAGVYPWRLHVVSSTASNGAGSVPVIVWAEEGASTGPYQTHWGKQGYSPVRCVRNLNMKNATAETILVSGSNYQEEKDRLVIVHRPAGTINSSSVYGFDFTNMNEESRRYYTTRELAPGDEYSVMGRLYDGFVTGEFQDIGVNYYQTSNYYQESGLKELLEKGDSKAPSGYRVPNVREGVVMYLYCTDNNYAWWKVDISNGWYNSQELKGTMVSNYYSFGEFGNQYDREYNNDGTVKTSYYSWSAFNDRVTVGEQGNTYIRFVKDWNPNTSLDN